METMKSNAVIRSKLLSLILKERSLYQRFILTTAIVALSFLITFLLNRFYPEGHLYSVNLASSILAAAFGGLLPGIIACAVEALAVDYFFTEPLGSIFDSWPSVIRVVLYLTFGWLTCLIVDHLKEALKSANFERDLSLKLLQSRETILTVVSHDLRGPLSAISMASMLMSKLVPEEKKASKYKLHIDNAIKQMNILIEDLLDAAKIEKGHFKVNIEHANLNQLIDQAFHSVQKSALEKSITIVSNITLDSPVRYFDFNRLLQVLINLLSNAIKFSPPFGKVILEVRSQGDQITFRIIDEGPGICREDRDKIFMKFWQADQTKHLGTGLGLFITKGIVNAHQGEIRIEDSTVGTTFSVHLNLRAAA